MDTHQKKGIFNVLGFTVRKAQKLDKGILTELEARRGKQLRPNVLYMIKKLLWKL